MHQLQMGLVGVAVAGRDHLRRVGLAQDLHNGPAFGDQPTVELNHWRFAQGMHMQQLWRGQISDRVTLVIGNLIVHADLFQQPKDPV